MECLRTKCANRSANAIANIRIQFFNIKIQFIDITKHGTNNKIYNLECKIQTIILVVITLHILPPGKQILFPQQCFHGWANMETFEETSRITNVSATMFPSLPRALRADSEGGPLEIPGGGGWKFPN
jgi:hypothetical protein